MFIIVMNVIIPNNPLLIKMKVFYFSIAGFVIRILFKKNPTHNNIPGISIYFFQSEILSYLAKFVSSNTNKYDYTIEFRSMNNVERVVRTSDKFSFVYQYHKKDDITAITSYQLSIWQFQSMLSDFLYQLLSENNGFALHCSAVSVNGKAYIFLGKSGAGKSTIVQLLLKSYIPLSDDLAIIRKIGGKFYLYQTPFFEKNSYIKFPYGYEISRIFFLHKSDKNYALPIQKELSKKIKKQVLLHGTISTNTKKVLKEFSLENSFYDLFFEKNTEKIKKTLNKT
ncbi:MAG: hypothetical protein COU26_01315 [Candidatus Levybacteria bacterium CG10_big_fil_rev_8_21_14_0_10_36_30]|nr:MAG: hypothetical protein COU26_01315 [Candidatus Levybacteria bacterium CG10_big_fil_rev_8_21_14_0_10_36_30]